jgi:hypothetical protein
VITRLAENWPVIRGATAAVARTASVVPATRIERTNVPRRTAIVELDACEDEAGLAGHDIHATIARTTRETPPTSRTTPGIFMGTAAQGPDAADIINEGSGLRGL